MDFLPFDYQGFLMDIVTTCQDLDRFFGNKNVLEDELLQQVTPGTTNPSQGNSGDRADMWAGQKVGVWEERRAGILLNTGNAGEVVIFKQILGFCLEVGGGGGLFLNEKKVFHDQLLPPGYDRSHLVPAELCHKASLVLRPVQPVKRIVTVGKRTGAVQDWIPGYVMACTR
ncbi:hypothetical protein Bbelb_336150 [Branchiostoma belcheri]|nr:hypothetical protein Bbelb_336150 [Branchiostoma belcheri]